MTTLSAVLLLTGGIICTCFGLNEWMYSGKAMYEARGRTMALLGGIMLLRECPHSWTPFPLSPSFLPAWAQLVHMRLL